MKSNPISGETEYCEPDHYIKEQLKGVLKKEGLTWQKLAELDEGEGRGRGSYRQTLLARLVKVQETFETPYG
jgi:hypothetical protein